MVSQVRDRCNTCAGGCREPRCIRSPGRGWQRLHRALGGTRILLAAAPTAPPCFCRWQRSSLLHRGFFPAGLFGGSYELRLPLFPQPLGRALKKRSAAPASPPCFRRRRRSAPLLFESTLAVPFFKADKAETPVPIGYRSSWWARVDCASRAAKNSPLGCFCAVFCDSAAAVRIHPLYEFSLVTKQKPQRTCIR